MPDALSKTVPIWCAVLNIVLFGESDPLIYLPPHIISPSEKSQIEKRIPAFLDKFYASGVDVESQLKSKIKKPLRPIWVTPDSFNTQSVQNVSWDTIEEFHPIVLCTASIMVQDNTDFRPGYTYVQGAADDHEEWASLLTPTILWDNIDVLGNMELTDDQLREEIEKIDKQLKEQRLNDLEFNNILESLSHVKPSNYWIGNADILGIPNVGTELAKNFDILVNLSSLFSSFTSDNKDFMVINKSIPEGKKGSKQLRAVLPSLVSSVTDGDASNSKRVLILCDTGSDFSVGLCLALLCLFPPKGMDKARDKVTIRQRLVYILSSRKVNPSRTTLNSVNSFLMS